MTSTLMSYLFEKLKRRSSSAAAALVVGNNKDVVGEILSRLPMSSVIQFRLVCKQWRSLTSTQFFLEMHENNNQRPTPACSHHHHDDNNNSCFVVQYFDNGTEFTSISDHFNILFFNIDTQLSAAATNNNNKMKKKKKKGMEMVREYIDLSRFTRGGRGGGQGWEYAAADKRKYYHINLISSYRGFLLYFKAKPTSNKFLSPLQTTEEKEEDVLALILYNPVTKEQLTVIAPCSVVYCGFYYHSPTKEREALLSLVRNPVLLTPSLASLQHHKSTGGTCHIGGGNCILSLWYKNHNTTTTLTEYYVQRS